MTYRSRRRFLKDISFSGSAWLMAGRAAARAVDIAPRWKDQIGLELFTVRDLLRQDYEGTLAKLAAIGYREVEPADPYNGLEPAAYKALLDKYGLSMFSTHSGASDGPGLEKELEGQALMGIKYTEVRPARPPGAPGAPGGLRSGVGGPNPPAVRGGGPAPDRSGGAGGAARQGGGPGGPPPFQRAPQSVESVKTRCAQLNKYGAVVKQFGMKILIHNHAGEFELLDDGKTTEYDVLVAETDPELVAMQLDIGWAYIGGQDAIAMFKKNPGRYELWHVKDVKYKGLDPKLTPAQRQRSAQIVTMGEGDIDYREVFAHADLAGLKYFVIEQDTAGQGGRDAVEDCRIAYENLRKILT